VPATIGRGGAQRICEWELSAAELADLHASAEFVRAAAAGI
jgi:malate/lactate dehydrogenase